MNLFEQGSFQGASGLSLNFKIDCDALSDDDIKTLAVLGRKLVSPSRIIPVPGGGLRLAKALEDVGLYEHGGTVLVDDVWTTGTSVLKVAAENNLLNKLGSGYCRCLVIFARGSYPHWVQPIFSINPVLKAQNFLWQERYT